jgi:hypothetical protein
MIASRNYSRDPAPAKSKILEQDRQNRRAIVHDRGRMSRDVSWAAAFKALRRVAQKIAFRRKFETRRFHFARARMAEGIPNSLTKPARWE